MHVPMDGPGGVGGNTETIEAGSQALTTQATNLQPTPAVVRTNGKAAHDAVGDAGAQSAVSCFTTAWSEYLTDLEGHVKALARLAQVGSQDLAAAGGQPTTTTTPTTPTTPTGLPGILSDPLGTGSGGYFPGANPQWPGQAPGWHPPMLPGYVPPAGST